MNRGFYSYVKKDIDIITIYTVEYEVYAGTYDGEEVWEERIKQFQYLEDAIYYYISLQIHPDCKIDFIRLFEEVRIDGDTVLEQMKDSEVPSKMKRGTALRTEFLEDRVSELEPLEHLLTWVNEKAPKLIETMIETYNKEKGGEIEWPKPGMITV